ncbi:hypothetical protein HHJ73_00890 [Mobiluncus mulieris]|uniref:hypothetical protein n=1 Tax=Mobiluncus mulieris TaxID=2052 RepID=UPI0014703BC4|nr:hypothetical protein [Mobiluncus mulieris]NMW80347.1 hypothetical protein [Mobiluncus mulieris]
MNPFTELLAIIDDWTKADGNTIRTKRGGTDVWVNVDRATRLLLEITDFLRDRPEPLPQQQELLDELWDFVVHPESLWSNMNHPQQDLSTGWRGMLQALAAVWDNESVPVKLLTPTQLQTLRETLIEIREQFGIVTQMPPDTRRYLADLVDRALACLDREFTDARLARSFVMETSGAVLAIFPNVPANQRGKLSKNISKALSIFGLTSAAGATGNLISEGITTIAGMIGS